MCMEGMKQQGWASDAVLRASGRCPWARLIGCAPPTTCSFPQVSQLTHRTAAHHSAGAGPRDTADWSSRRVVRTWGTGRGETQHLCNTTPGGVKGALHYETQNAQFNPLTYSLRTREGAGEASRQGERRRGRKFRRQKAEIKAERSRQKTRRKRFKKNHIGSRKGEGVDLAAGKGRRKEGKSSESLNLEL